MTLRKLGDTLEQSPDGPRPAWWLDYDVHPGETATAKAVWISGQWLYIAFAGGIPLRRLCSSIEDADEAVALYEQLGDLEKTECVMTGSEADPGLNEGPTIYSVVDEIGPHLIVDWPESMRTDSYASFAEAQEASRLDSAPPFP